MSNELIIRLPYVLLNGTVLMRQCDKDIHHIDQILGSTRVCVCVRVHNTYRVSVALPLSLYSCVHFNVTQWLTERSRIHLLGFNERISVCCDEHEHLLDASAYTFRESIY